MGLGVSVWIRSDEEKGEEGDTGWGKWAEMMGGVCECSKRDGEEDRVGWEAGRRDRCWAGCSAPQQKSLGSL